MRTARLGGWTAVGRQEELEGEEEAEAEEGKEGGGGRTA